MIKKITALTLIFILALSQLSFADIGNTMFNLIIVQSGGGTPPPPPVTTAQLTVNFEDTEGNTINAPSVTTHTIGDTIVVSAPVIAGYTAVTGDTSITITPTGNTHTIIYSQNPPPPSTATITINYKDIDGNTIAPSTSLTATVNTGLTVSPINIAGFITPAPVTIIPHGDRAVDFIYSKIPVPPTPTEVQVTIKYVDENGLSIAPNKIVNVTKNTSLYVEVAAISGYTPITLGKNYDIGTDDETIIVTYKKNFVPPIGGGGGGATPVKPSKPEEPKVPSTPEVEIPPSETPKGVIADPGTPLISGYADKTFRPDRAITRAETASIVYNLLDIKSDEVSTMKFNDVNTSDWFNSKVSTLTSAKYQIFVGYPDGSFKPNNIITRAEMTTIITGLAYGNILPKEQAFAFEDIARHWAKDYIQAAVEGGIVAKSENIFRPNSPASRAEIATMFVNAIKRQEVSPDTPSFVDLPKSHWAYSKVEAIVRAK